MERRATTITNSRKHDGVLKARRLDLNQLLRMHYSNAYLKMKAVSQ
jgi:hypothetical protein